MICRRMKLVSRLALVFPLLAGTDAVADIDAARAAARRAEAMVARQQYQRAEALLSNVDCGTDRDCRSLVDFSYGWVYGSWADGDRTLRADLLRRSLAYYGRALRTNPDNAQILGNYALAARRAGDDEAAAQAISRAIEADPRGAPDLHLFLGDILLAGGDRAAALREYRAAVDQRPGDPRGHRRIIELYRADGASERLFDYCRRIELQFPEIAAIGYEYGINSGYREDPAGTDRALAAWTALRADLGPVTAAMLRSFPNPESMESNGLRQLRTVVESDDRPPIQDEISWWMEDNVRSDALARLFRSKAAAIRAWSQAGEVPDDRRAGALQAAIAFLGSAVKIAPPFYVYLDGPLAGWSIVRLDAATDLVSLHHVVKAGGDPLGLSGLTSGELAEMTQVLFDGKGDAYAAGNLEAIQRFHTVLGLIYHLNGQLSSGGPDNATYQLSHALDTAARIAEQSPERYRPRPDIQAVLADVYMRRDRPADSARLSLDAAMGFLETDNLAAADEALSGAREGGADARRVDAVSRVLAGRLAVQDADESLVRQQADGTAVLGRPISWVANADELALPKRFVDGQRFKVLADLGAQQADAGNEMLARSLNVQALIAVKDQKALTSARDLRRITKVSVSGGTARSSTGNVRIGIERGARVPDQGAQDPRLTLPSAAGDIVIRVDERLLEESTDAASRQARPMPPRAPVVDPRRR